MKYDLDRTGYETLLERFSGQIIASQRFTNHYFDTPKHRLREAGWTLRVRTDDNNGAVIALKFPTVLRWAGGSQPKIRWELEDNLALEDAHKLVTRRISISDLRNRIVETLLANLGERKLEVLRERGALKVERTIVAWIDGTKLEIDTFQIAGVRYYEVEIEAAHGNPEATHAAFTRQLNDWKIDWEPSVTSKRSRVFDLFRPQTKS